MLVPGSDVYTVQHPLEFCMISNGAKKTGHPEIACTDILKKYKNYSFNSDHPFPPLPMIYEQGKSKRRYENKTHSPLQSEIRNMFSTAQS